MLNFGPYAVPLAFLLVGFVVGRMRRIVNGSQSPDARLLAVSILLALCFLLVMSDSDNIMTFLQRNAFFALLFLFLVTVRYRVPARLPTLRLASRWQKPPEPQTI